MVEKEERDIGLDEILGLVRELENYNRNKGKAFSDELLEWFKVKHTFQETVQHFQSTESLSIVRGYVDALRKKNKITEVKNEPEETYIKTDPFHTLTDLDNLSR